MLLKYNNKIIVKIKKFKKIIKIWKLKKRWRNFLIYNPQIKVFFYY